MNICDAARVTYHNAYQWQLLFSINIAIRLSSNLFLSDNSRWIKGCVFIAGYNPRINVHLLRTVTKPGWWTQEIIGTFRKYLARGLAKDNKKVTTHFCKLCSTHTSLTIISCELVRNNSTRHHYLLYFSLLIDMNTLGSNQSNPHYLGLMH
jgi:hypothetical protein